MRREQVVGLVGQSTPMPRYLLKLRCQGLVIDIRGNYYDSLLEAYQDALYGDWEILRFRAEDGTETPADSVEIVNEHGDPVLTFWVKGAFTEH